MRDRLGRRIGMLAAWLAAWGWLGVAPRHAEAAAPASVSREEVEQSIKAGVAYLLKQQRPNGGWGGETGESALTTLALLTAGETPQSEPMRRALEFLRSSRINPAHATYTIALNTMVFAAADPEKYRDDIARNAEWLEQAQTRSGAWTYNLNSGRAGGGDNSNTQYALLGLHAASEAGFPRPGRGLVPGSPLLGDDPER